jgi:hypothetical protein
MEKVALQKRQMKPAKILLPIASGSFCLPAEELTSCPSSNPKNLVQDIL